MVLTEIVKAFDEKLGALADSIREKSGIDGDMTLDEMKAAVDGIETGGGANNAWFGTYTIPQTVSTKAITIPHGLSKVPSVIIVANSDMSFSVRNYKCNLAVYSDGTSMLYYNDGAWSRTLNSGISGITENSFNLNGDSSYWWKQNDVVLIFCA